MSKKRMLADVLWEAANEYLWDGVSDNRDDGTEWSCNAALRAEVGPRFHWEYCNGSVEDLRELSSTSAFLQRLGADPHFGGAYADMEAADRQGARYMWLLLAMHVAEDEGIEV